MKARFYLVMTAVALLMANCSKEEAMELSQGGTNTLTATIEGASRSAVTDGGVFSWTTGDAISVYNGTDFTTFNYTSGNAFSSTTSITPSGVAIYPAGNNHSYDGTTASINLASEYAYGSTNAPMLAEIGGSTLEFKHVGGLMRFVVKGMPSGEGSFTFTANSGITGDFAVNNGVITTGTANNNSTVTINFTADESNAESMTFYIPLPTGTYEGYTVTVGEKSHTTETTVTNTIARGTLLLMPTFTYDANQTDLVKNTENIVAMNNGEEMDLSVADDDNVTVNVADGATATLNLTAPETTSEGTVSISDGSAEGTASTTSTGTLNVTAANVANLNINTPTLTVKLTEGTYEQVEATTATNTLIIGEGVTIGKLIINGGNVKLEGDLELPKALTVSATSTFYLNGHNITAEGAAFYVKDGGNLTIEGEGTVSAANNVSQSAVYVDAGASATIKGGEFSVGLDNESKTNSCIYSAGGTITIEGGKFSNAGGTYGGGGVFNVLNGSTTGKININKVDDVTVGEGSVIYEEADVTNGLIVDNLILTESALKAAIAIGGNVALGADITLTSCLQISKDVTLSLNGNDITATGTAIYVTTGTLTIEGDGTVSAADGKNQTAVWAAGGSVVINNGTFSVGIDENGKTNSCIYSTGGEITINGGSFINAGGTYDGGGIFNVQNETEGKITINAVDNITVGAGSVIYEEADKNAGLIEDKRTN